MGWYDEKGWYHEDALPIKAQLTPVQGPPPDPMRQGAPDYLWANVMKPTAFEYGGHRGGAGQEQQRYEGLAGAADNRAATPLDTGQFGRDMTDEQTSVSFQNDAVNRYGSLARGGWSPAQEQLRQNYQRGLAQTGSQVAGARGGGSALVAAQAAGADAAARQSGAYSMANQQMQARQQMQATQGLGDAATARRQLDQQRTDLYGQASQSQALLEQQQRQQNDARNLEYEKMRRDVFNDQMTAQQAGEAINAQAFQNEKERQANEEERTKEQTRSYVAGGATAAAALLSDVRAKKEIGDGAPAVREQLGAMQPYTYQYRQPDKNGQGERVGVMAQDMERGPYGKQLVKSTQDGKKIDGPGGLSLALAGVADQEKRLRAIEERFKPQFEPVAGNMDPATPPDMRKAAEASGYIPPRPAPPVPTINVGGPRMVPPAPPPRALPYGPTPEAADIARATLPPQTIGPVGPTPTADEIAAQHMPATWTYRPQGGR